jgi:tetratricopeptide (TPR) repeat protein
MGASQEAIEFYTTALVKAQDLKRVELPIKLDQIHERLGDVYLNNLSKISQALKHYHKFLSLAKRWDEKMRGERKIAAIYLLQGDLDEAHKYYQSALGRLDGETLVTDASLVHGGLAYVFIYRNQLEEAEKHANAALNISTRLDDSNGMAYAHNAMGHIAVYRNDLENAYQHFTNSLALYQAIDDLPRTAKLCNNLGETARLLGKMETAQSFLSEGLSIARRVGDKRDEAAVLSTSADIYMDQGCWEEAVKVLTAVLPIAEESGVTVRLIEANWFLGTAYRKAGQLELARHHLEFAEQLCLNTEYVRYLPKIYLELAGLEVLKENYTDARRNIHLASEIEGDEPGDEFYGQLERLYGYLSSHQQDWETATTHYEKALEYIQKTSNPVKTAQVHFELGESYVIRIQEGDRERALENLLVARSVFQQISATYYLNLVEAQLDKLEIR